VSAGYALLAGSDLQFDNSEVIVSLFKAFDIPQRDSLLSDATCYQHMYSTSTVYNKATTMRLLISHQLIMQECMRADGLTHFLIIYIIYRSYRIIIHMENVQ